MGVTQADAIKAFLTTKTHPDLAKIYNRNMECQVVVSPGDGELIQREYQGRKWQAWTNGDQTWKPFRIPYKANSNPEYEDKNISFSLQDHAEGIGMTGWDWNKRMSRWVAFDFDAIIGHSDKHSKKSTQTEMQQLVTESSKIPWVTVRRSTSGKGIHLYVFLKPVPTKNHVEHSALARAILSTMSSQVGMDFHTKVDICGGNMWVWHRKMADTDGLDLIKEGCILEDAPFGWEHHIKVVTGKRKKILPDFIQDESKFEELSGQRARVKLDQDHKRLLIFLDESGSSFWWDQDHHMLVAHTYDLHSAYLKLNMRGIFETVSTGREHGVDHNCFLFPMRKGAWSVRRYGEGVVETHAWDQDSSGWTRCFFNKEPDLATAARSNEGVEDTDTGFVFAQAQDAIQAAKVIGVEVKMPTTHQQRETKIKQHKDGRLVVQVKHESTDDGGSMQGWLLKTGKWQRIFSTPKADPTEREVGNYDDTIRHLVDQSCSDGGWVVRSDGEWHDEPLVHIRNVLDSLGFKNPECRTIIGNSIVEPWKIVNLPFQQEYPGNRQWNRNAAQLAFIPSAEDDLNYPTWLMILNHIGESLDGALKNNSWANENGITKGSDYLKCWIASLFQYPYNPLPYLFLYGPQNSGKSILHEALCLLFTKGYQSGLTSLTSQGSFTGELENAILCFVEEINLNKHEQAYNRIKDWVTSRQILIHHKMRTPYLTDNTTHWIQCSNTRNYCPVFPGDTRITMFYVKALDQIIPKESVLMPALIKEAPDFLAAVLRLELPRTNDRLGIPAIETDDKITAAQANQSQLDAFIEDYCHLVPGHVVSISGFYNKFEAWLDPTERHNWTKRKVSRNMPPEVLKGRFGSESQWHWGNITFDDVEPSKRLVIKNNCLVEE